MMFITSPLSALIIIYLDWYKGGRGVGPLRVSPLDGHSYPTSPNLDQVGDV